MGGTTWSVSKCRRVLRLLDSKINKFDEELYTFPNISCTVKNGNEVYYLSHLLRANSVTASEDCENGKLSGSSQHSSRNRPNRRYTAKDERSAGRRHHRVSQRSRDQSGTVRKHLVRRSRSLSEDLTADHSYNTESYTESSDGSDSEWDPKQRVTPSSDSTDSSKLVNLADRNRKTTVSSTLSSKLLNQLRESLDPLAFKCQHDILVAFRQFVATVVNETGSANRRLGMASAFVVGRLAHLTSEEIDSSCWYEYFDTVGPYRTYMVLGQGVESLIENIKKMSEMILVVSIGLYEEKQSALGCLLLDHLYDILSLSELLTSLNFLADIEAHIYSIRGIHPSLALKHLCRKMLDEKQFLAVYVIPLVTAVLAYIKDLFAQYGLMPEGVLDETSKHVVISILFISVKKLNQKLECSENTSPANVYPYYEEATRLLIQILEPRFFVETSGKEFPRVIISSQSKVTTLRKFLAIIPNHEYFLPLRMSLVIYSECINRTYTISRGLEYVFDGETFEGLSKHVMSDVYESLIVVAQSEDDSLFKAVIRMWVVHCLPSLALGLAALFAQERTTVKNVLWKDTVEQMVIANDENSSQQYVEGLGVVLNSESDSNSDHENCTIDVHTAVDTYIESFQLSDAFEPCIPLYSLNSLHHLKNDLIGYWREIMEDSSDPIRENLRSCKPIKRRMKSDSEASENDGDGETTQNTHLSGSKQIHQQDITPKKKQRKISSDNEVSPRSKLSRRRSAKAVSTLSGADRDSSDFISDSEDDTKLSSIASDTDFEMADKEFVFSSPRRRSKRLRKRRIAARCSPSDDYDNIEQQTVKDRHNGIKRVFGKTSKSRKNRSLTGLLPKYSLRSLDDDLKAVDSTADKEKLRKLFKTVAQTLRMHKIDNAAFSVGRITRQKLKTQVSETGRII